MLVGFGSNSVSLPVGNSALQTFGLDELRLCAGYKCSLTRTWRRSIAVHAIDEDEP
jgi:hypothetical protein